MTADSSIHRLLDEAFAGVAMTPDLQDLKEELRGSLAVRAEELEAAGTDRPAAAAAALTEVGDIPALIAAVAADGRPDGGPDGGPDLAGAAVLMQRHRVRPRPAFVVRTVLLALILTASAVLLALNAVRLIDGGIAPGIVLSAVLALAVVAIAADALRQETTIHFPSPTGRAIGWGASGGALAAGLGLGAVFVGHPEAIGVLIAAIVLTLAGVLGLTWAGVTQTNRTKPWALELGRRSMADDRFSRDPAAAARFGIYTIVIWIVGIAAFLVLGFTVGFAWSWLAILATIAVFFLVLARMNFPADERSERRAPKP